MNSKNKPAPTAAEKRHIERLKDLHCAVCGSEGPIEVHEPEQGEWFAAVPLCVTCHRHPVYGWHGQRRNWKAAKVDEIGAIAATVRQLMEPA